MYTGRLIRHKPKQLLLISPDESSPDVNRPFTTIYVPSKKVLVHTLVHRREKDAQRPGPIDLDRHIAYSGKEAQARYIALCRDIRSSNGGKVEYDEMPVGKEFIDWAVQLSKAQNPTGLVRTLLNLL
jgi:hypothetical protein